jgi:cation transporter-like permease
MAGMGGLIPTLPPTVTDARVVLGSGIVAALAVILFMATEGSGANAPGFSEGPSIGAYVGLICAVAIAVGGYLMQQDPEL